MAVVQISKIQIRRGLKNSNVGVPQLSSAELAWAVDSQELFIGNGSVAEGAPEVGNTKVLTEHDNILELASSYRFASSNPSITRSEPRPLLDKIDEIQVSVRDFGAVPDGSTDCTTAFSRAFQELFQNADPDLKKILYVPNGTYLIASELVIPSFVKLRGETQDSTIIHIDTRNISLTSDLNTQQSAFTSSDKPKDIRIENLTIRRSSGSLVLTGLEGALLKDIIFDGEYNLGNTIQPLSTETGALFWDNSVAGTKVDKIVIDGCTFKNNPLAIKCTQDIVTDTKVTFKDCKFYRLDTGVYVSGATGQINEWKFDHCEFEEIHTNAIKTTAGRGFRLNACDFKNVGNEVNEASTPVYPMIEFGESRDNIVTGSTSNRMKEAGFTSSALTGAVTEVYNADYVQLVDRNTSTLFTTDSFKTLAVFSVFNNFYEIDYTLRIANHIRRGTIRFTVGDDLSIVNLSDSYEYSDTSATRSGGVIMTNFQFDVSLADNDADSGTDTIVLSYKNPIATGANGIINFGVTYGV